MMWKWNRFVAHDGAEGLSPDGWLPDRISIGVLTRAFPPELVDEVVEATGTREQRRRLLPARLMVYFVLALWLFRGRNCGDGAGEAKLAHGLCHPRRGPAPPARWVAAAESGTGSLLGAALGPYTCGEQVLALDLLHCFGPGMLVLADRNFLSWSLARAVLATGARILWRASASFTLKPVKVLADGTYLAELKPPRKSDGPVITVRVIEYTVHTAADNGTEETSEVFCLVTSLLDTEEYPALDLACRYPDRWGCETVIGHHKTDMGEGQPVLRSKDPQGVIQEMWALFAVYQAICPIIGIAVNAAGVPPARISFPHALAAAPGTVAAFPP